jgi:hypothetical protein
MVEPGNESSEKEINFHQTPNNPAPIPGYHTERVQCRGYQPGTSSYTEKESLSDPSDATQRINTKHIQTKPFSATLLSAGTLPELERQLLSDLAASHAPSIALEIRSSHNTANTRACKS